MLLTLPFTTRKILKKSLHLFSIEHEEGSSSKGIDVLLSFLWQPTVESVGEFLVFHAGGWEICHETMIALSCLGESLVQKILEAHPRMLFLLTCRMRHPRSLIKINLDVNLKNEWWTIGVSGLTKHFPVTTTNNHMIMNKSVRLILLVRIIPYYL
jgi:hypothetical protein